MTAVPIPEPVDGRVIAGRFDPWRDVPVTSHHAAFLTDRAITPQTALAVGIYSVTTPEALPADLSYLDHKVPGIVFPWNTPAGDAVSQFKPDNPDPDPERPGKFKKYLFPKGSGSNLGVVREDEDSDLVLIVEGTKQSLAAASYTDNCSVYAVAGCRNWSTDGVPLPDLDVAEDKNVVVIFDDDVASNINVWQAAERLARNLKYEGARSVKFTKPVGGKDAGLDDILGPKKEAKRSGFLRRLVEDAGDLPKKPAARTAQRTTPAGPITPSGPSSTGGGGGGRPFIDLNEDKLDIINGITDAMSSKWSGERLFNYGGVLSWRDGLEMIPLNRDLISLYSAEAVRTGVFNAQTGETQSRDPSSQTLGACLVNIRPYAPLIRISRTPFVRADGTICQTSGYDAASQTFVILDESLSGIEVPEHPTRRQVDDAVAFLRHWMVDFFDSMPEREDQANVFALALTPLVRSLVPVVPLCVINGREMGVGKGKLVEAITLVITGRSQKAQPYHPYDDAEMRKSITTFFKSGIDLVFFDEAHDIRGLSLARALTAPSWNDRELGGNRQADYPNQATWMSAGNNVQINDDLSRRTYQIKLSPKSESPMDRGVDTFVHQYIEEWTLEHRGAILQALLTLVRAWFDAGQPDIPGGRNWGSFEKFQGIVGGILAHAGIEGFVENRKERRSESDHNRVRWSLHFHWLRSRFEDNSFTAHDAVKAMKNTVTDDEIVQTPPGKDLADWEIKDYSHKLGIAWATKRNNGIDGLKLVVASSTKGHANKWAILTPEEVATLGDESSLDPEPPVSEAIPATPAIPPNPPRTRNLSSSPKTADPKRESAPVYGGVSGTAGVAGIAGSTEAGSEPCNRPSQWVAGPAPASSAPLDALLADVVSEVAPCRTCGGPRAAVPPANILLICPTCYPDSLERK